MDRFILVIFRVPLRIIPSSLPDVGTGNQDSLLGIQCLFIPSPPPPHLKAWSEIGLYSHIYLSNNRSQLQLPDLVLTVSPET
jgi:hypothetical protein